MFEIQGAGYDKRIIRVICDDCQKEAFCLHSNFPITGEETDYLHVEWLCSECSSGR